jgi:hypothetical protein
VCTLRLISQEPIPPPPIAGIATLRLVEPAVAPVIRVPAGQLFVKLGVAATARLAGKVSLKATFVADAAFTVETINVRVESPGATISTGLNCFAKLIGNCAKPGSEVTKGSNKNHE